MNAWENVPHDPLMTDDELEELYSRPAPVQPERHDWWPKLVCLAGVCAFWLLFWYGASR